jgi:GNAT superfamily N-acetyltransferase
MNTLIKTIDFEVISKVWANDLWPNRKDIETHSAMNFLQGYDIKNMTSKATFLGVYFDDTLAGVNSGHMCHDRSYRSRGLFVYEKYRNMGIGKMLLQRTINQGFSEGAEFVWSFPRQPSWRTYSSVGFTLVTDFQKSDFSYNAFCKIDRN